MFTENMSTTDRGNVGVAFAITYYVSKGYVVSLPISQNQEYDLVIEKKGILERVSVKTVQHRNDRGAYVVQLATLGGNQSFHHIKKFDNLKVDRLFVVGGEGNFYDLPAKEVNIERQMCIDGPSKKWAEYEVQFRVD